MPSLTTEQTQWYSWLCQKALPLWDQAGFDEQAGLYHERLTFAGAPIPLPHRRLMVQARQVATYCQAALNGHYKAGERALACLAQLTKRYHRADGQAGWVFALGPDLAPSDTKRDLYGHAFILFAHGWAYRLSGDTALLTIAEKSLAEIDALFPSPQGGYRDAIPALSERHSQNPHMHLLEACLTLFEVSQREVFLHHAEAILALALRAFIPQGTDALLEFFTPAWTPEEPYGRNRVEPGHQAEWCWLLGEYHRLAPTGAHATAARKAQHKLYDRLHQTVPGPLLPDALYDDGTLLEATTRIWPQTEMMRLLAQHAPADPATRYQRLCRMSQLFFTQYAPATLFGGWIDRLDEAGNSATDHMPASSLYHIYSAGQAILNAPPA
ncbi:AGE family epimerase/isomerase [Bombella pollinis]|uniref:AGE family epimerase/isomerase n=1 Tax=Bombella pollinis TaxID=2967337 RepID=A0ABT3WQ09_9PROT|nr:AGE family epimerase/isomerase [Bombella pollinis]MCX5619738.1 AGE family epimerase/isomerase [Bombella pollinis]